MIDLHCHSSFSDGTFSPTELIKIAQQKQLTALALTDHDTIDGIDEFLFAAKDTSVKAIPGIEFSTSWYGASLHIVGLFINHQHPALKTALKKLIDSRSQRNLNIINKLNNLGKIISLDDVKQEAQGESIGRPHIARALIKRGYCSTIQEAFYKYLAKDKAAYVRRHLPLPQETIKLIHQIGGVAIWAHPLSQGRSSSARTKNVIAKLQNVGLDGLECYYTDYTSLQEKITLQLAKEFQLIPSGGSDCHGSNIPNIEIGTGNGSLNISDELAILLEEKSQKYHE